MEKILVIQTAFIGDAILTLPMIQVLKRMHPSSKIDVLSIPATSELFTASPYVNNVIVIDKHGKHKRLFSMRNLINQIKTNNFSMLYSPHRSLRTALIVMQSKIVETFGFSNSSFKHVFKYIVEYKHNKHEVQRNFDLIGFNYRAEEWKILPEVDIPVETKKLVDDFFVDYELTGKISAIAPGSVWNTKQYPHEYFEEVIKYLLHNDMKVLLIGGANESDLCKGIADKFNGKVISIAGKFSLLGSIEILKRTKLLISNDSAPTHLGMCSNIHVLTIYCSTVADFGFYPYNNKSCYLSFDNLTCKPCGVHGYNECPRHTFECGYKLTPDRVIFKIEEMLND